MPDPALSERAGSDLFAQNLKKEISAIKAKLERLTDAYLSEALELAEFQQTKNALMAEKKTKEEKLSNPALLERAGGQSLARTHPKLDFGSQPSQPRPLSRI